LQRARPKAILIVALFLFVATAVAVVVGTSLLLPLPVFRPLWELNKPAYAAFASFGKTAGVLLLALGLATGMAGTGLLRGRRWAWWIAAAVFAVNGCGDVVSFAVTRDAARSGSGVLIAGAFLFYLTRPNVRAFCNGGQEGLK
jgi:hypothetical protein